MTLLNRSFARVATIAFTCVFFAGEFAKSGLKPASDDGSDIQRIRFSEGLLVQDSLSFYTQTESDSFSLSYPDDFLSGPDLRPMRSSVTAANNSFGNLVR